MPEATVIAPNKKATKKATVISISLWPNAVFVLLPQLVFQFHAPLV